MGKPVKGLDWKLAFPNHIHTCIQMCMRTHTFLKDRTLIFGLQAQALRAHQWSNCCLLTAVSEKESRGVTNGLH